MKIIGSINFVFSPEGIKARANKTEIFSMILILFLKLYTIIIFQRSLEPVLIQRIVISFEAILEK